MCVSLCVFLYRNNIFQGPDNLHLVFFIVSAEINTYLPQENNINITIGITTHKKHHIKNFESIDLCENIKNKKGHIINTGGSIWGIDFVPKKAALPDKTHYLAVGGYNSTNERHHYKKEDEENVRNAIQIWQYTDETAPKLSMCILHEFGIVIDFKWCPFSVYDEQDKLGILAVLFGDGDIRLFVVPHPQLVHHQENIDEQETIYRKFCSPFFHICEIFLHIKIFNLSQSRKSKGVTESTSNIQLMLCLGWKWKISQWCKIWKYCCMGYLEFTITKNPCCSCHDTQCKSFSRQESFLAFFIARS